MTRGEMGRIDKKYKDFFAKNIDSGAIVVQGSRRSGKTWAILLFLPVLAAKVKARKVMVVAPDYPMLRATMTDFEEIYKQHITGGGKYGYHCGLAGVLYEFRSFDKPHKAQGTSADIMFFNEAAQMNEQMVMTASLSSRARLIFDYNPTRSFWIERYIFGDRANYLHTTWRDNVYLSQQQQQYFLDIETRANSPQSTAIDRYMRDVYCFGQYNELSGNVFENITEVPRSEWPTDMQTAYGLDFGFKDDPTALVEVGVANGVIYAREVLYSHGLDDTSLATAMAGLIDGNTPIVFDWGAGGDVRAANLARQLGGWFVPARKGRVVDDLAAIARYKFALSGPNLTREAHGYELSDGKVRGDDHALDAMRYAAIKLIS